MTTATTNPTNTYTVPSVSITTARTGASSKANALGMRAMQERAYAKRGEQYLLIKSPPASGKSRALMFIALDKLHNQGLQQAIIVVPERSIGSSFADEPLSQFGFYWDWQVAPQWNLCNAPGVHGCKQDAEDFALGTAMNALAEDRQCLVLYPEQSSSANSMRCWNWFDAAHQAREAGEPKMIAALIRKVLKSHDADPSRVYIAGLSRRSGRLTAGRCAAARTRWTGWRRGVRSGSGSRRSSTQTRRRPRCRGCRRRWCGS